MGKRYHYFWRWTTAYHYITALAPDRRCGAELRRSRSTNSDRRWVVVVDDDYHEPNAPVLESDLNRTAQTA